MDTIDDLLGPAPSQKTETVDDLLGAATAAPAPSPFYPVSRQFAETKTANPYVLPPLDIPNPADDFESPSRADIESERAARAADLEQIKKDFPHLSDKEARHMELSRYQRSEDLGQKTTGQAARDILGEVGGEFEKGATRIIPSTLKTAGAIGSRITGSVPETNPLYKAGYNIENAMEQVSPSPLSPDRSTLHDVAQGLGQVGSMVVASPAQSIRGALALSTVMGGVQEFDDAYSRARNRGDTPNVAFAKSLGYATVAALIENRLGAGRILRKYFPDAGQAAQKLTAMGVGKEIIKDFIAGGAEEGSQRFAQNWIIDEKPSMEGVMGEAVPGAIVEGLFGLPHAGHTINEQATSGRERKDRMVRLQEERQNPERIRALKDRREQIQNDEITDYIMQTAKRDTRSENQDALDAAAAQFNAQNQGEPNASAIRSNQAGDVSQGQIAEGGENVGGANLQQPAPGESEPVAQRETPPVPAETVAQAPAAPDTVTLGVPPILDESPEKLTGEDFGKKVSKQRSAASEWIQNLEPGVYEGLDENGEVVFPNVEVTRNKRTGKITALIVGDNGVVDFGPENLMFGRGTDAQGKTVWFKGERLRLKEASPSQQVNIRPYYEKYQDAVSRMRALPFDSPERGAIAAEMEVLKNLPPSPAKGNAPRGMPPLPPVAPPVAPIVSKGVTEPNPSPAQIEAGNAPKREIGVHGLKISIENEAGSMRRSKPDAPVPWEVRMPVPYGYVQGFTDNTGENPDLYLGPQPERTDLPVFVVDQIDPDTKKYDEPKSFMGFATQDQALTAYQRAFSDNKGAQRVGAVTQMTLDQWKDWLKNRAQGKALAYKPQESNPAPVVDEAAEQSKRDAIADAKRSSREGAKEFDRLLLEYAPVAQWVNNWEDMFNAVSESDNLGTLGIKAKILNTQTVKTARQVAARALGLDPARMGEFEYRAEAVTKFRQWLRQKFPQIEESKKPLPPAQEFKRATETGPVEVQVNALKVGDVLNIEGEKTKVTDVDPDTGDVTVEDGTRFGTQKLSDGTTIYAEDWSKGDEKADFLPAEDQPSQKQNSESVLLIPEPEEGESPRYGIAPGYYNEEQMLSLIENNRSNSDALYFIVDMLEHDNPELDTFANALRARIDKASPLEIQKIVDEYRALEPETQEQRVKKALAAGPSTAEQLAETLGIISHNIRRILGEGTKAGKFVRIARGVYGLKNENGSFIYIQSTDAVAAMPELAKRGVKVDFIFLDPPYKTVALVGGNRGVKDYGFITPEQFNTVVSSAKQMMRTPDTPIYYMFSQAPSGLKEMQRYTAAFEANGLKLVAMGAWRKTFKDGRPVTNVRGDIAAPEGLALFNESGKSPTQTPPALDFTMVRPPSSGAEGRQSQKPVEMYSKLIGFSTETLPASERANFVTFDPFAGTGGAAQASKAQGVSNISFEIDENAVKDFIIPRVEATKGPEGPQEPPSGQKPEAPKPPPLPQKTMRPLTKSEQLEFQELSLKARAARERGGEALTSAETRRYQELEALAGAQDLIAEEKDNAGEKAAIADLRRKAGILRSEAGAQLSRANKMTNPAARKQARDIAYKGQREAQAMEDEANKRERAIGGKGQASELTLEQETVTQPTTAADEQDLFSQPAKPTVKETLTVQESKKGVEPNEQAKEKEKEPEVLDPYRPGNRVILPSDKYSPDPDNPTEKGKWRVSPDATIVREVTDPNFPDERQFEIRDDKTGKTTVLDIKGFKPAKEPSGEAGVRSKGKSVADLREDLLKLNPKLRPVIEDFKTKAQLRDAIRRERARPSRGYFAPQGTEGRLYRKYKKTLSAEQVREIIKGKSTGGFNVEVISADDAVRLTGQRDTRNYDGFYWKGKIYLVHDNFELHEGLTKELNDFSVKRVLNEEVGHALLDTPQGRALLKELFDRGEIELSKFDKSILTHEGYKEDEFFEEFIAKSFRGDEDIKPGWRQWLNNFFERVGNYISGRGFKLDNDSIARALFREIQQRIGKRPDGTITLRTVPQDTIFEPRTEIADRLKQQIAELEAELTAQGVVTDPALIKRGYKGFSKYFNRRDYLSAESRDEMLSDDLSDFVDDNPKLVVPLSAGFNSDEIVPTKANTEEVIKTIFPDYRRKARHNELTWFLTNNMGGSSKEQRAVLEAFLERYPENKPEEPRLVDMGNAYSLSQLRKAEEDIRDLDLADNLYDHDAGENVTLQDLASQTFWRRHRPEIYEMNPELAGFIDSAVHGQMLIPEQQHADKLKELLGLKQRWEFEFGDIKASRSKLRQAIRQFTEKEAENPAEAERAVRLGQAGEAVARTPRVQSILQTLEAQARPAVAPTTNLGRTQRDIARKALTNQFLKRAVRVPVELLNESRSLVTGAVSSFQDIKNDPNSTPDEIAAAAGNALNAFREYEQRYAEFNRTYAAKREDITRRISATVEPELAAIEKSDAASVLLEDLNELAAPLIRQTKDAAALNALSITTDRNRTRAVRNVMQFIAANVDVPAMYRAGIGQTSEIVRAIERAGGANYNATVGASDEVIQAVSRVLAYAEPLRERLEQARNLTWLKGQNAPFDRFKTRIVEAILAGNYGRAMNLFTRSTQNAARAEQKFGDAASFYARKTKALLTALQALDTVKSIADEIKNDPDYKADKERVYNELNVREILYDHRGTSLVFKPLQELDEPLTLTFGNDSRKTNEVLAKLSLYKAKALALLADPATEPERANGIRATLPIIDNLLNPSIRPEASRLLPGYAYWPVKTFFGLLGRPDIIPKYVLAGGGGQATAMADASMNALRTMGEQRQRIFQNHEPKLQLALSAALKSHGNMSPETYRTRIWNLLVGSRQNFNDTRKLSNGAVIGNGERITDEDMDYLRTYAAFQGDLLASVNNVAKNKFESFKHVMTGVLFDKNGMARLPFATGENTLGRHFPSQMESWLSGWRDSNTPDEWRDFLNKNFDRLVMGYVDGVSRADWNGKFQYQFGNELRRIIQDAGTEPIESFDDLVDKVTDRYNAGPVSVPLNRDEVEKVLFREFDKIFNRLEQYDKSNKVIDRKRTLDVFGGDTSFNTERGNIVMPPGWYDYGGVTNGDWSGLGTVAMNPFYLAHLASVEQLNDSLLSILKNFAETGERAGEKRVVKASADARVRGDLIYSWADAKALSNEVGEYLTKLRQLTQQPHLVVLGDRPQVVMTNGAIQLTMSSILTPPQTLLRNFTGQAHMVMADSIIRNQMWPVSIAKHGALFIRDAYRNVLNALAHEGNPVGRKVYDVLNNASMQPVIGELANFFLESINARRDLYNNAKDLGLSLNKNLGDALAGMQKFATTAGIVKPREPQSRLRRGMNRFSTATRQAARVVGQAGVGYVDAWLNTGGLTRAADYEQHFKKVAQKYGPVVEALANSEGRDPWNSEDPLNRIPDKAFGGVQRGLFVREFFRRGVTVNLDKLILDYYRRWKNAAPSDRANVNLFTQDQFNELAIANAEDFNLATFSNRPIQTKLSGFNSKLGLLLGYPAWTMHKFPSFLNTQSRKPAFKAAAHMLPFAISTALGFAVMSILGHDAYERIKNLMMNKYGAFPTISQARSPEAVIKASAAAIADDIPFYGFIAWQAGNLGYKKRLSLEDSLFLLSYAKDIYDTGKEIYQTHDAIRPTLKLLGRYMVPFNLGMNRIPLFAGSQELTNAKNLLSNSVRASGDEDKLKEPTPPGDINYTKATPHVNRAMNAIGNGDFDEFIKQYNEIVRVKAEEGDRDPQAAARKLIAARNPVSQVFKKLPTPDELEAYISALPAGQEALVRKQLANYQQAATMIGASPNIYKVESYGGGGSSSGGGGIGGGLRRLGSKLGRLPKYAGKLRLRRLSRGPSRTRSFGRVRAPGLNKSRMPRIRI